MLINTDITVRNGVGYLTDPVKFKPFQKAYLAVRKKENRLFPDEHVAILPHVPASDRHYHEWCMRKDSLKRFGHYIKKNPPGGAVLDIGCGNGWFTDYLKDLTGQTVIGMDVNVAELEQAARVFKTENLFFVFGDVFEDVFHPGQFHLIVLNSSIQYFNDLDAILNRLSSLLHEKGEIHLLDSPFYADETDALQAKERSHLYYNTLGFPEMAASYHHHHYKALKKSDLLTIDLLFDPKSLKNKLIKRFNRDMSPFPWIRVTKR